MSIDVLIVISTPDSQKYLSALLSAADRANCSTSLFFTHDGVKLAARATLGEQLAIRDNTVVCADSWSRFLPNEPCPLTLGSQTDHSRLAGDASKIISL